MQLRLVVNALTIICKPHRVPLGPLAAVILPRERAEYGLCLDVEDASVVEVGLRARGSEGHDVGEVAKYGLKRVGVARRKHAPVRKARVLPPAKSQSGLDIAGMRDVNVVRCKHLRRGPLQLTSWRRPSPGSPR